LLKEETVVSGSSPVLEVTCRDVQAKLQAKTPFVFLDCREPEEYALCRIEGALLLPMSQLTSRVTELEPHRDAEVIVHCHHGGRSLRVAMWLRQQGFSQAASMSGGIDEWSLTIDPAVPRY
jgi:rhodanese-related sulfurtransferase